MDCYSVVVMLCFLIKSRGYAISNYVLYIKLPVPFRRLLFVVLVLNISA
jgi:hypothetical protein